MGDDGHTASLFPGMLGLDQALASPTAYVAVDASGCPGSGPWPRRISLTPAGLEPSRMRLLLIRGEHKRRLFERAMDGTDPLELPIRDRKSVVSGKRVSVRVDLGGRRDSKKKKKTQQQHGYNSIDTHNTPI